MTAVLAAHDWPTNGHMIADVARLGYLAGSVLDVTYGEGGFWTQWRPQVLRTSDLYKPAEYQWDYKALPIPSGSFDAVVFDPPYKLSGTPASPEMDARYGTGPEIRMNRADRLEDIRLGALECWRVCREHLLVKCMDQVEGGRVRWQADMVTRAIEDVGGRKIDCFHFLGGAREQPAGRRQLTARRNYSTLLVFEGP